MGRFVQIVGRVFSWTPRPPYDWRELMRQMVKVGVDSVPVVMLTSMFTGMVLALQTFSVLRRFNAESFVGSLVSLSMVRELSPVLSGLIVAGRAGSAMGAELGTMRVTEQIDALEVMATDPVHYLVVPRVWASTIMLPLLVVMGNGVGIFGGYLVAVVLMGANPVSYIDKTFQFMDLNDLFSGLVKAAVFGFLMAAGRLPAGVLHLRRRRGGGPFDHGGGGGGVDRDPDLGLLPDPVAVLKTLTPWPPLPPPPFPPHRERGNEIETVVPVGCAVRTMTVVEGAHSAPYRLDPSSQIPPLPVRGEGRGRERGPGGEGPGGGTVS